MMSTRAGEPLQHISKPSQTFGEYGVHTKRFLPVLEAQDMFGKALGPHMSRFRLQNGRTLVKVSSKLFSDPSIAKGTSHYMATWLSIFCPYHRQLLPLCT